jgi:hypothetical protein
MNSPPSYPGLHADRHGLTQLGRIVLDARVFGLVPDDEQCAGWSLGRMQELSQRVEREWDRYGNLPSRLPPELAQRHRQVYDQAISQARAGGWDPELSDDE